MQENMDACDPWWLYVLLCEGDRLYIGIAKNVDARLKVHQSGHGAFFTKLNKPVRILARQRHSSQSTALKAEYALKQLKTEKKWAWVLSWQTQFAAASADVAHSSSIERVKPAG